jgi:hypothetical protein
LLLIVASLLAGCSSANNVEQRPFFQQEYDLETHGRKTWLTVWSNSTPAASTWM